MSRARSHGSKRFLSNRVTVVRRFIMTQKTVYDLKLLVIFLKKSVMFFKKLVMFYQSLADPCCLPVYSLIIYKTALDKIRLIHDVKGLICKYAQLQKHKSLNFLIPPTGTISAFRSLNCKLII